MNKITRLACLVLAALLLTTVLPTLAANTPSITISPVWRVANQLTTDITKANPNVLDDDGDDNYEPGGDDDDVRFVTAEIWATTAYAEFWAAQISCTVNPKLLESYVQDTTGSTDAWQDDQPMVWAGSDWYSDQGYTEVIEPYNAVSGAQTFTYSKIGNSRAMGNLGGETTLLLASIQYRVKSGTTAVGTSPLTCKADLLDRDGKKLKVTPKIVAPAALPIVDGYTLSGQVTYQSRAANNITVSCALWVDTPPGPPPITVTTAATGRFTLKTRELGYYECFFSGNINNTAPTEEADIYLRARASAMLESGYTFLPFELAGGNTSIDAGGDPNGQQINQYDVNVITGRWNMAGTFATGDVNGDSKVDKTDLSIAAGNWGQGATESLEHWLLGLHINGASANYDDYNVWFTDRLRKAEVDMLVTGGVKFDQSDSWPTLSPDGSKIAFIREETITMKQGTNTWTESHYGLWVVNADGKSSLKRLTPLYTKWQQDAFAPSWSPDGTRIAFVCSWQDYGDWNGSGYNRQPSGYVADEGDICVIDADGRNLNHIYHAQTRIFPPAWYNSNEVVFGGSYHDNNGVEGGRCRGTLCMVDVSSGYTRPFDYDNAPDYSLDIDWSLPLVSDIPHPNHPTMPGQADMPRFTDGRLVYRYAPAANLSENPPGSGIRHSSIYYLNFAEVDGQCRGGGPGIPCTTDYVLEYVPHTVPDEFKPTPFLHTNVTYNDSGTIKRVSNNVNFVEVSPGHQGVGILFHGEGCDNNIASAGSQQNGDYNWDTNSSGAPNEFPEWGNPDNDRTWIHNSGCGPWSNDDIFFALPYTVDWVN